mmetsp:Transcript_21374/g.49565  ORF Transcript_21374/g.49565 Transcript_21374/m.49565 type:complete len:543 (+) Transcript_21374:982-2610(+)
MVLEVCLDLGLDVCVVGAVGVEPKDSRGARRPAPGHGKLDPVTDRGILGLAHAEDVTFLHREAEDGLARGAVRHLHAPRLGHLKRLVVRSVLLRLLRHQADVADVAHGRDIKLPVSFNIVYDSLVHGGIASVGYGADSILKLVILVPHTTGIANDYRHRSVDNHIRWDVEVGDALCAVDHGDAGLLAVARLNVCLDKSLLGGRESGNLDQNVVKAVLGVHTQLLKRRLVLCENLFEKCSNAVSKHDGVRDLHHGSLQVKREEAVLGLSLRDSVLEKLRKGLDVHDSSVNHLALLQLSLLFEHLLRPISTLEGDLDAASSRHGVALLGGEKVLVGHVGNLGLGASLPLSELVGVLLSVGLDGGGRAAVRVALAKHRVHSGPKHLGVTSVDLNLLGRLRLLGVVGDGIPLALELGDRLVQLGDGRGHVGQLDDVRLRGLAEFAKVAQVVGNLLLGLEPVVEMVEDAGSDGDVRSLHVDAGRLHEALDQGEEGVGGKHGRLVRDGIDDLAAAPTARESGSEHLAGKSCTARGGEGVPCCTGEDEG